MVIGAVVGYFIAKKINDANYNIFIEQAKAKAKAIEFEAKNILSNAKLSVQEAEFAAKKKFDDKFQKIQKEYDLKFSELDKKSENLVLQEEKIEEKIAEVDKFRKEAQILYDEGQLCKSNYEAKISEALLVLERSAGLTTEEARAEILRKVRKIRAPISLTSCENTRRWREKRGKSAPTILSLRRRRDMLESMLLSG